MRGPIRLLHSARAGVFDLMLWENLTVLKEVKDGDWLQRVHQPRPTINLLNCIP